MTFRSQTFRRDTRPGALPALAGISLVLGSLTIPMDWSRWNWPPSGSIAAFLVNTAGPLSVWMVVALLPILYLSYRSRRAITKRLEAQRTYKDSMPLHRRIVDLLALAMEAKDHVTHAHLERVEKYAVAVGRDMGLNQEELEALRAAALLHDIGKLAVPEYIISKPGKLTPLEFEKMKTHAVVGAEIVEQIGLPYSAAPIVRSHHERWDGAGYPDGLSGEAIPVGARILAAVDCLDALASDRHYRRAYPLKEAINIVAAEAGKAFDPKVVSILVGRYLEFEVLAKSGPSSEKTKLSTNIRVMRGGPPAAGYELDADSGATSSDLARFNNSLAKEGASAGCMDQRTALSMLGGAIRDKVCCDLLVIYRKCGERLIPERLEGGHEFEPLVPVEVPLGIGLSGWVAENMRSIVNGNPAVELCHLENPAQCSDLRSALAIPIETRGCVIGVVSLFRKGQEAFTSADLERLQSIGPSLAIALNLLTRENLHRV